MHLLGIFAHPDDEAYGFAGSMARYSDEGFRSTIVTFTRGEAGQITPGSGATRETLGEVREAELHEACRIVGCDDVRVVGTKDGGTTVTEEGIEFLMSVIHEIHPQVVVTMEPAGITMHPDHIAVCEMTTEAVRRLEPDAIVQRLFYAAVPQTAIDAWVQMALDAGGTPPFDPDDPLRPRGADPSSIACVVPVDTTLKRKIEALWAHKTQSQEFIASQSQQAAEAVLGRECFQRAFPPFAPGDPVSDDLFDGLR